MTGFVVVGTDTDSGKTTFCVQWLTAFREQFAYWKPIESGPSDTETIRRLVPGAMLYAPLARYRDPVAPELAAEREGRPVPGPQELLAAVPNSERPIIVETFGGALSPLSGEILQVEWIAALALPLVLVASSALGAIARTLQGLAGLREYGLTPIAIVLVGAADDYAAGRIEKNSGVPVFALEPPIEWSPAGVQQNAKANQAEVSKLRTLMSRQIGPAEKTLVGRDRSSVWHPYTALGDRDDPLPVIGATAEFLQLADGRRLIDAVSSWWTILHGHRQPSLMTALREATLRYDHVLFAGLTHPPAVELAELLLAAAPWPGGRVFYSDNGSTAVEVALKMAYQAWRHRGEPGRTLFVGFENGYHGDTFGAMAVGRDPLFFGQFDPLLFRALRVPISAERLADALNRHRGQVAAIIVEPLVQGAAGMCMHSPEELKAIADVARDHGVFLIADEVMTGGGRTGTRWAYEQAKIAPDLICASKTLTGGVMPLAATLASPEVVAAFDSADRSKMLFHGHSFTGHPLACAVAVANCRLMATEQWQSEVSRIEAIWRDRLLPLSDRRVVNDVRIRGSIAAIELDCLGGYLAGIGRRMHHAAVEQGVLLRPLGNVLYALPPYCTSDDSLGRIADAMEKCVSLAAEL